MSCRLKEPSQNQYSLVIDSFGQGEMYSHARTRIFALTGSLPMFLVEWSWQVKWRAGHLNGRRLCCCEKRENSVLLLLNRNKQELKPVRPGKT